MPMMQVELTTTVVVKEKLFSLGHLFVGNNSNILGAIAQNSISPEVLVRVISMVDESGLVTHEPGIDGSRNMLSIRGVEIVEGQILYQSLSNEVDLAADVLPTVYAHEVMPGVVFPSKCA